MRYLINLHLINWHYIEYRTISLSKNINFLTGETGSGKSTILDALQLIIMGDLRGHYFNKAANENSRRKVIEYLKGMVQENSDEGKKFLRNDKDFNSYIVIEVLNSETNEKFCLGVIFEVRKESMNYEHIFFKLKGSLPKDGFIKDKTPLTIKKIKENYGSLLKVYTTEEYIEHFLYEHMGKLKKEFYDVFKKAVAFKPPASIEDFIEKFICDDIKIDVDEMVVPIKIYKKMEKEAEIVENQVNKLKEISDEHKKYIEIEEKQIRNKYIYDRSNLELEKIKYEKLKLSIEDTNKTIENEKANGKKISDEIDKLEQEIEDIKNEIENSEEEVLRKEIEILTDKICEYKKIQNTFNAEAIKFERWVSCIEFLNSIDNNLEFKLEDYKEKIIQMKLYNIKIDNFNELNAKLKEIAVYITQKYRNIVMEVKESTEIRTRIKDELYRLSKGIVYPNSIGNLKNILEIKLEEVYGFKIRVDILADLIEVRDKEWLDALEGYMNWQKMYLVVEPKYYQEAINIYNSLEKNKFYDAGIVDVGKIIEAKYKIIKNSLAEEIVTDNIYARAYIDYLLGRVVKCDDIKNIRSYNTTITKDCFIYKGYIAKRLNPDLYLKNRCIGEESRVIRIKKLNVELEKINNEIENLENTEKELEKCMKLKIYSKEEVDIKFIDQEKIKKILILKAKVNEKEAKLSKIDLFYLENMKDELDKSIREKNILKNQYEEGLVNIGKKEGHVAKLIENILAQEYENQNLEKELYKTYEANWIDNIGNEYFDKAIEVFKNYNSIITSYKDEINKLNNKKEYVFNRVKELRTKYCVNNMLTWDINSKDNDLYNNNLTMLVETKLTEYIKKIERQKNKAYEAFKSDLLSRLKDAINKTEEQIIFMNRSLEKMSFGEKKYKFIVKPKTKYKEFYEMLKSDFLGMDLGESLFAEQYKDQTEFLFNLIVNTTENYTGNDMEQLRKQIDIYTDYKTYLNFDMEQKIGEDKSDLSKTLTKNSGGETQSPFFISVLAAFANHYRIYNKKDNNTMRLIIFDEAFSKMDEEHANISIQLLRELGFQAIIAAPDDKIPVIGPNVDKIIYMKNENKRKISVFEFEDKEIYKLISSEL